MNMSGPLVELIAALGEIRFTLSDSYEASDQERKEQIIAVIDYAMRPYDESDLDACLAFAKNPLLKKEERMKQQLGE